MKVNLGISARHLHISKEDYKILFGKEELTKYRDISQKGQYAAEEEVTIKSDKNEIKNVRILGPFRKETQIEIAKTEAYFLGINPPIRSSKDLEGSSPITLIGPKGEVKKDKGCIIATRHLHANLEDAKKFNLKDNQKVKVYAKSEKSALLENVFVTIDESYVWELHLDTDDANANFLKNGDELEVLI